MHLHDFHINFHVQVKHYDQLTSKSSNLYVK